MTFGRGAPQAKPQWAMTPTHEGAAGKAWKVDDRASDGDPRVKVHVGTYLLYAPMAHPLWSWHFMSCIALRDEEGVDPPVRHYPEAEYELLVMALHPDVPPPDPRTLQDGGLVPLEPPDAVVQFHGVDDDGARELLDLCARAVASGILVPDSDHRAAWEQTIRATLRHPNHG